MKKAESKKEKKEIKKKAAPAKKAAPKAKKEVKKPEIRPKKVPEAKAAPKVEVQKEEHRAAPFKKKPPQVVQYHGTGGRKTSGARVWISEGSGQYNINGRPLEQYVCGRRLLHKMALEPFVSTNTLGKYDVFADARGGGICSQIGAVREAVSEAIVQANPDLRPGLRKSGLLTRDPRVKERKKYGQKRARKRFQYSKR